MRLPWAECVRKDATTLFAPGNGKSVVFASSLKKEMITARPAVKPKKAMLHSLLIPGWGQLNNGSRMKAALFLGAELFFIGGYFYESSLVKKGGISDFDRENHRTNRNTFVIYFFVSKLIGMTDAYVDAQLADFNVDDIRPVELDEEEELDEE